MRLNYLLYAIGLVIFYFGLMLLVPVSVALIYQDYSSCISFLLIGIATLLCGFVIKNLTMAKPDSLNNIKKSEALFIVAISWVLFSIIASIPYLTYGFGPIDALFEGTSGITTTGATIFTHFNYPKALFFWRSFTQFLGGMGIIVLFIAVLPQFAVAGRQMFFAEAPGPTEDKLFPRIRNTASALWGVYVGLTILAAVLLYFAGMPLFDAVCNAMSTMSAGGFSPNEQSIMGYNSTLINWIMIAFMFFAGASFMLQVRVITQKNPLILFKSEEFRYYTYTLICISALVFAVIFLDYDWLNSVTASIYQVVSIATSTGSVAYNYNNWSLTAKIFLFIAMFTGSCAASAGAGIKMTRWILVFKSMKAELIKLLHPNAIINIKVDNKIVQPEIVKQVIVFIFFYFAIFGISAILLTIFEQNAVVGLSGSISALGNIGPGFGAIGPDGDYANLSILSKIVYIIDMIVGRLELIPFLVLLRKDFWSIRES